jgi:hypothetical protein
VPEGEDFHSTELCIDLVVKVVASSAQKKAANRLVLRIASACADAGLGGDEFEGSFEVIGECEWGRWAIGSPPSRSLPNLPCGSKSRLYCEADRQRLLAKLTKELFCIDELTARRLFERNFEGGLFFGRQLEGFVRFRHQNGDGGTFFERIAIEFELALDDFAGCDSHNSEFTALYW